MKRLLIFLLALTGCCSHEEIRIIGSSNTSVEVYDPNDDTIYIFSTKNWDVMKIQNWNRH